MTVRHHQPLQVTPGETDQGDLPDTGFPDALAVYPYDWDPDALDYVKHETAAAASIGTVAQGAAGTDPWPVTATIDTTGLATSAGQALQATTAKQDTGNASLASIDGKVPALGQALAASSVPVILPSATVTTLTPPAAITGFATSANQTTELTSLSSIDGKLTNPLPVSLPAATVTTLTPPAAITGFATSANQTTELASLSSLDGKILAGTSTVLVSAIQSAGTSGPLPTVGMGSATLTVTSTAPGNTIAFYGSEDGSNYYPIYGLSNTGLVALTHTTNGTLTWSFGVGGYQALRVQITVYAAGSITVTGHATVAAGITQAYLPQTTLALPTNAATETGNLATLTTASDSARRWQEAQYLQEQMAALNAMIGSEAENSQRMGFELR